MKTAFTAGPLLLLLALVPGSATLIAVYSLQRHGARNVLPKGILLTEGDLIGGPTLLPEGQYQTYGAGVAFRSRYLDAATCASTGTCLSGVNRTGLIKYGVIGQPGVSFGNWDVYVRSSSLDRTIMSGLCFFNGIFPADPEAAAAGRYLPTGAQVVPIYTQSDPDDILIRAYTKCPAYQEALLSWFAGAEFAARQADSAALRAQVAAAMPGTDTSLQNWWNVYDGINVWRTYGVGDRTPNFTDATFAQIQSLAYWLETAKMRSNLTRNLLGGTVLADLTAYLQAAVNATRVGSQIYYKLLSLSGHYNTQLGVLAALQLDVQPASANFTWFSSIPKLAATLVFELHASNASAATGGAGDGWSFFVRLVAQDGPAAPYVTVPLPCASDAAAAAAGAGACGLGEFVAYALARAFGSPEEWCAACGNTGVSACRMAELSAEAAGAAARGGGSGQDWKIAVSVVVTAGGCVLLTVAVAWLWVRRRAGGPAAGAGLAPAPAGELTSGVGGGKGGLLQTTEMAGQHFRHGMANAI